MSAQDGGTHVVIVGAGFAGLGCARELAKHEDVRVTLIDRNNYHQFQPLLYQVATSQLARGDVAFSLRKLFRDHPNIDVKLGEVASVDPQSRSVTTADGQGFGGDVLVLAAGSRARFFKTPGAAEHAFPLYSLDDAERLRARILDVFEAADRDSGVLDEGALTFVVVGAGATGTEIAGALAEMINGTLRGEYPDLPERLGLGRVLAQSGGREAGTAGSSGPRGGCLHDGHDRVRRRRDHDAEPGPLVRVTAHASTIDIEPTAMGAVGR